jgi:hypothetical protein
MGRFVKSELVGWLSPTRLAPRVQVVTALTGVMPGRLTALTGVLPGRLPPMGRFVQYLVVGFLRPTRLAPRVQVVTALTGVVPERLPPMGHVAKLTGVSARKTSPLDLSGHFSVTTMRPSVTTIRSSAMALSAPTRSAKVFPISRALA